jgi:hypothetical protein
MNSITDIYAAVNVDIGPSFSVATISPASITVGQPVTISYRVVGAISVVGDFVGGKNLPLGSATFTVFPDRNTNYTLTATSVTGLTTQTTLHVDVAPQQLSAICSSLPFPVVNNIALDGIAAVNGVIPQCTEDEEIRILEVFGDHILGDRPATSELINNVQVLIIPNSSNVTVSGIEVVEVSSVSNNYVRAKIRTHAYTKSNRYTVALANDVGITSNRSVNAIFAVNPRVPDFIMNNPVNGQTGGSYDFFLDNVDPIRDQGLAFVINGTMVKPSYIGSNLNDTDFITGLYAQILGRSPDTAGLNAYLTALSTGTSRRSLMNTFLTSAEYKNRGIAANVLLGTKVTVKIPSATSTAVAVQTNNGYGATQVQFLIAPPPPSLPSVVNTIPVITGIFSNAR